jgi:hypothetical protein
MAQKTENVMRPFYDGIGVWFSGLEELGYNTTVEFAVINKNSEFKWLPVMHKDFDGVGGLVHLLRLNGHKNFEIPKLKFMSSTSLLKRLRQSGEYFLKTAKGPRLEFASKLPKPMKSFGGFNNGVLGAHIFSVHETNQLLRTARDLDVTLNTILLFTLNSAVRTLVERPEIPLTWMVPINMRGPLELSRDTANHASMVEVMISREDTLISIHSQIRKLIEDGWHWWFWHLVQLATLTGKSGVKAIMRAQSKKERNLIGAFSNLGSWNLQPHADEDAWLFCPPVAEMQPLGVGAVTAHGRLTLTAQVHPGRLSESRVSDLVLERWLGELKKLSVDRDRVQQREL